MPFGNRVLDAATLALLILLPVGGIWVFGGNRFWIMSPLIMVVLLAAVFFITRFFVVSFRDTMAIPPGTSMLAALSMYLTALLFTAQIPYEAQLEIFRFVSYFLAYWMWVNLLRFHSRWKWVLALLMLSVSIMAWYALIQDVHGTNRVLFRDRPEQYGMRASGAYICPNHFAHLLQMMIPVCVAVTLCRGAGIPLRLVAGYTFLMALYPLYLTESRSGWIGLMAGLVTMAVAVSIRKGGRAFLVMLVAAPLMAASFGWMAWKASPRIQARVEQAIKGDIRLPLWQDSLVIAQESPWIGHGLGSYRWMFPHYQKHLRQYIDAEFAHNDFLHFWIEMGLLGVVLAAGLVLLIVRRAVRIIRKDEDGDDAWLMGGMLGAMAGSFAHAFFDFNFHIFGNVHVFILLLGALIGATFRKSVDRVIPMSFASARWIAVVLFLVLAGLTVFYVRASMSYRYVEAAEQFKLTLKWDEAQREYEKAVAWSPGNWKAHLGLAHLMRTRSFWMRHPDIRPKWIAMSREHYEVAMRQNPWAADAIYGLGSLYKMEKNHEAALEMRRLAVEKVPHHVFYLNELGLQLKDMGYYQEALEVFLRSRSLEQTPLADRNIPWLRNKLAPSP